mmetsp:Transcript_35909/g.50869  ORF Transcript_35909/g.50869 Transcript_35909/m.50869 type:complete len:122 (-) Transcript_35909:440-805(-)
MMVPMDDEECVQQSKETKENSQQPLRVPIDPPNNNEPMEQPKEHTPNKIPEITFNNSTGPKAKKAKQKEKEKYTKRKQSLNTWHSTETYLIPTQCKLYNTQSYPEVAKEKLEEENRCMPDL